MEEGEPVGWVGFGIFKSIFFIHFVTLCLIISINKPLIKLCYTFTTKIIMREKLK